MIQIDAVGILKESPLLLLFLVAAAGYAIGQIKIGGFSLGIAAVLFTGLAVGAIHPELKLPEFVSLFGLVIFVYSVGLSSGPGLSRSLRGKGLKYNVFAVGVLLLGAALTLVAFRFVAMQAAVASGLFCGSFTNTPALGAVIEAIKGMSLGDKAQAVASMPVLGYSVAYPFGVIGVMLSIYICQKAFKVDYVSEAASGNIPGEEDKHIINYTLLVKNEAACEKTIEENLQENHWRVIFGRHKSGSEVEIVKAETRVKVGDMLTIVGVERDVKAATEFFGEVSSEQLDLDRRILDYRRISVSRHDVVEKPLSELFLSYRFGGIITRVRRGDVEFLPNKDTVLELGDRVRVVAPREKLNDISKFLGDSEKAGGEIDIISFSIGIALGLLLGSVPLPLPGGGEFKLGYAGGPLIMGLILGIKGRSGGMVWQLPFSANLTLRQLGLVLFLAGVGTRSGYAFVTTFREGNGLALFAAGAAITFVTVMTALIVGYKLLKIPMLLLIGMICGIQTQPAALAFANEQSKSEAPNVGYAMVYPVATITKIIVAQTLLSMLS